MPGISLRQTVPLQGQNSGAIWNLASQSYPHQDSTYPQTFHGVSDLFPIPQENQPAGRASIAGSTRSQWSCENAPVKFESPGMSRYPSQDSIGAHSQGTTHSAVNTYDQSRSRIYPTTSPGTFHNSPARSDVTGRSTSPEHAALCTPGQIDMPEFDYNSFSGEDITGNQQIYPGVDSQTIDASIAQPYPPLYAAAAEVDLFGPPFARGMASQDPMTGPSMYQNIADPGFQWDNTPDNFFASQRSSPTATEDTWSNPHLMTSSTNSPANYSEGVEAVSPRYVLDSPDLVELPPYATGDRVTRKPMGPRQSKVEADIAAGLQRNSGAVDAPDEAFKQQVGRSNPEENSARLHPLYQNVNPGPDGLYHCPWEAGSSCQHKPEKLKCNYDKYVDSHLKPYRCKVAACETLQFSSTACLLRHEREAHAMHGHGNKPFLCTHEGCERASSTNGFPRHWNLRDHMKRVHNDNGSTSPPPTARGKKRKSGEQPENRLPEKAVKSLASPVVVHQPQEPSLMDQYNQDFSDLLGVVEQLRDPKSPDHASLCTSTVNYINAMHLTSKHISGVPAAGNALVQQTG
ncbi:hypothetical protein BJ875DRAFT_443882 [Amylocarpus encephaloides]|uniref:C2H2-type domain-containing protein n=1 Tax=Amylocarpus encephaloides TaxID=45428 RepID=A0A9P8C318_9HELO|nr:hypothetical protein BJ875DRAFT_443882 [Amylocarpus encephaloides]